MITLKLQLLPNPKRLSAETGPAAGLPEATSDSKAELRLYD